MTLPANHPDRVRTEGILLACNGCGLVFTGDPKHDTHCPTCGSEELVRA